SHNTRTPVQDFATFVLLANIGLAPGSDPRPRPRTHRTSVHRTSFPQRIVTKFGKSRLHLTRIRSTKFGAIWFRKTNAVNVFVFSVQRPWESLPGAISIRVNYLMTFLPNVPEHAF